MPLSPPLPAISDLLSDMKRTLSRLPVDYEDLLAGTEDENGKDRFFISFSAEHGTFANATFDIGVAKATLTHLITSCEAISIEKDDLAKWKAMLDKMPTYLVNPERSEIGARPALRRCKGS